MDICQVVELNFIKQVVIIKLHPNTVYYFMSPCFSKTFKTVALILGPIILHCCPSRGLRIHIYKSTHKYFTTNKLQNVKIICHLRGEICRKSKLCLYSLHFQEELNSSQPFGYTFKKTLINIMDTRWELFCIWSWYRY